MKYSIIAEPVDSELPLDKEANFKKVFSDYNGSYSVSVIQNQTLKLGYRGKIKESMEQIDKTVENCLQVPIEEEMDWKSLKLVWGNDSEWILVFESPFRLYFVVNKYRKILPIKFDEVIDLSQMSCYISYPDLFLYGHEEKSFSNRLFTINLQTFQAKEITSNKDYSPKGRNGYWSLFSDSRLYVAGGNNSTGKPADELMWTLNIQNGYWFALDFNQDTNRVSGTSLNCEFQNGKILVVGKESLSIVELYQSKVRQVEGWRELISPEEVEQTTNVFLWEGWIYFIVSNSVIPKKFKINKTKAVN